MPVAWIARPHIACIGRDVDAKRIRASYALTTTRTPIETTLRYRGPQSTESLCVSPADTESAERFLWHFIPHVLRFRSNKMHTITRFAACSAFGSFHASRDVVYAQRKSKRVFLEQSKGRRILPITMPTSVDNLDVRQIVECGETRQMTEHRVGTRKRFGLATVIS